MQTSKRPPLKLFKKKLKETQLSESLLTYMLDTTKDIMHLDKKDIPYGARKINEAYVYSKVAIFTLQLLK